MPPRCVRVDERIRIVTILQVQYSTYVEARALILQWYRRRMGITVVRAMARHRWRHCTYVGPRECSWSTPGGGRIGSTRGGEGAGGAPFGGGSEDGAGALLRGRPEW